jgi:hypothetical protein
MCTGEYTAFGLKCRNGGPGVSRGAVFAYGGCSQGGVTLNLQALIEEYTAKHGRNFGSLQAILQAAVTMALPLGSPAVIADLLDQLATEAEIAR